MNTILTADTNLFFAINNLPHTWVLNQVFLFFSFYPIIIWVGIATAFMVYERKHKPRMLFELIVAGLLAGFISTVVLKPIFVRPRPDISHGQTVVIVTEKPALVAQSNEYSFPSGHAAVAFAAAYILTKHQKKHRWWLYLWATITAFSRIYLGKHYPLDVLFGGLLGYFVGYAIFYFRRLNL